MRVALLKLRTWISSSRPWRDDDRGASLVEYALLLALIAMVCFLAVQYLGDTTSAGLNETGSSAFINPN